MGVSAGLGVCHGGVCPGVSGQGGVWPGGVCPGMSAWVGGCPSRGQNDRRL